MHCTAPTKSRTLSGAAFFDMYTKGNCPATRRRHSPPLRLRLLRLLERLQIGLRTDYEVVVVAQARTAGDQVTADHVLLEVLQRIDLGLDGRLVQHLGRLLERSRRDEARSLECGAGDTLQHLGRSRGHDVAHLHRLLTSSMGCRGR